MDILWIIHHVRKRDDWIAIHRALPKKGCTRKRKYAFLGGTDSIFSEKTAIDKAFLKGTLPMSVSALFKAIPC